MGLNPLWVLLLMVLFSNVCLGNVNCCIDLVYNVYVLQVRLVLDEPEAGVTTVKLTHSDIPEEDRLVLSNYIVCFVMDCGVLVVYLMGVMFIFWVQIWKFDCCGEY